MPRKLASICSMDEDVSSTRPCVVAAPEDTVVPARESCSMTPDTTSDTPRTWPSVLRSDWPMPSSASASCDSSPPASTETRLVRSMAVPEEL